MALLTTLQQLEEVQAAITAVMATQEYRLGDLAVKKAKLESLTARENSLLARNARETRGSGRIRPNFSQGGH